MESICSKNKQVGQKALI